MPDKYYSIRNNAWSYTNPPFGQALIATSSGYVMDTARAAINGSHPAIVTAYGSYLWVNSGYNESVHFTTQPNVPGGQTSVDLTIQGGAARQWYFLGGVSAQYSETQNYVFKPVIVWNNNSASYGTALNLPYNTTYAPSGAAMRTSNGDIYQNGEMLFCYRYQQVPSNPGNLRSYANTGTYGAVDLYWDAPSDWGDGTATGYNVYVNGGLVAQIGTQTSYTVTGLNGNGGYNFTVSARNNVADTFGTSSTTSNNSYCVASGLWGAVSNLSASMNGSNAGRIDLSWSQPGYGAGSNYCNYAIYQNGNYLTTTSNTYYSPTGLNNWQSYSYYIVAQNQFGNASNGNTASATSPGVPSQPVSLNSSPNTATSGRINLSWAQPGQVSGGITRYTIYNSGGTQIAQVGSSTTSTTVDGYTPGSNYSFSIRAWNSWGDNNGQSGNSGSFPSVTAQGNSTPPKNVAVAVQAATIGSVAISWTAPDTPGVGGVTQYNVYVDNSLTASTTSLNYTLLNVSSNATHNFSVSAINAWNSNNGSSGIQSSNVSKYVPGTPSAPLNLNLIASTTTAGLITAVWDAPSTIGGTAGAITHYTVYRSDNQGVSTSYDTQNRTYDINTTPKSVSNVYVVAWNDAGDAANTPSPQSNTASANSNGGAQAPSYVTVTPGSMSLGRLTVTWLPPSGTIVNYTVTRNDGVVVTVATTKYVDDTVIPNATYSYVIQATNTTGVIGDPSTAVSGVANSTATNVVNNSTVIDQTNTDLSGDFTINGTGTYSANITDPSNGKSTFSYRQITPALSVTSVPSNVGTVLDDTNVFLNGTYYGSVVATNQINIAKSGTPFNQTDAPNGSLTDNTNVALNGNGKTVTAINAANKAFSYATSYQDTSQRSASGTVVDRTNEVFNNGGNPVTLSSVTGNTLVYPITGANVSETTATGTAIDVTNSKYFNGHYAVSSVLGPTSIRYQRVPANLRASLTNLVRNPRMETLATTYNFRHNRCSNPSFETDLSSWTPGSAVTAVRSTSFGYSGSASMLVTKSANADANSNVATTVTGLTVGMQYSISAYFLGGNGDAKPYLSVDGRSSSNPVTLTTSWQRTSYTFTATATSHNFNIQAGTSTVANSNFYVDAVLIEETNLVLPYFDGNTAATSDFTHTWVGTANASRSMEVATSVKGVAMTAEGTNGKGWARGYATASWTNDGSRSLALVNRGTHDDQYVDISGMVTLVANKTYTFAATVKTLNSVINKQQIRLQVQNSSGSVSNVYSNIAGTPGVYSFTGTFNTTGLAAGDYVRLYNQTNDPGNTVLWDSIMIVEGSNTDSAVFSGATTSTDMTTYAWTGTADDSTSTRVTDLTGYSGSIGYPYGGVQRSDNPAAMDIFYRSGWLG